MKRIIICLDGTWDDEATPQNADGKKVETNVVRFKNSVPELNASRLRAGQEVKYIPGVGTGSHKSFEPHPSLMEILAVHQYLEELANKVIGGITGVGLELRIIQGYTYLVEKYEEGDEIFILGFSRGAYSARSLVGFIRNCGLLDRNKITSEAEKHGLIAKAFEIYRKREGGVDSQEAIEFRMSNSRPKVKIKFIGVWDTVCALGLPYEPAYGINHDRYKFHDTELSGIVENAYHAMALDEHRDIFKVTLWLPKEKPKQTLEQRWFIGSHGDVGGGNPNRDLSDITLHWMQTKARKAGLCLDRIKLREDMWDGPVTDSYQTFLDGVFEVFRKRYARPVLIRPYACEELDPSVLRRLAADSSYRPINPGLPPIHSLRSTGWWPIKWRPRQRRGVA